MSISNYDPDSIDEIQIEAIVDHLVNEPSLYEACRKVGANLVALRRKMARDEEIKELIEEAEQAGIDILEDHALRRALGEYEEVKMYGGKVVTYVGDDGETKVATERQFSDRVLLAILKAKRPELYGDRSEVTHKGNSGVLVIPQVDSAEAFKDMLAQAAKDAEDEQAQFEERDLDAPTGQSDDLSE